jgi:hypothetical protein
MKSEIKTVRIFEMSLLPTCKCRYSEYAANVPSQPFYSEQSLKARKSGLKTVRRMFEMNL